MVLGDGTDDRVIMLQQLMFQYIGVWISTSVLDAHASICAYMRADACVWAHVRVCLCKI